MSKLDRNGQYASVFILISGISAIGLFTTREQSSILFLSYFSAFFAYFWLSRSELSLKTALILGISLRLLLFLGMPTLSDDVYRFIWDGTLVGNGINPYGHLPDYYLDQQLEGLSNDLFNQLNSKPYFSIYPPFNQLIFWIATQLGASSWLVATNSIRLFLMGADLGSFLVLRQLLVRSQKNPMLSNWYWLNPLVILEFTGNIHFEGLMIFFILLALYALHEKNWWYAGAALGLAAATKLIPLILLPAVLFKHWMKNGIGITAIAITVMLMTFMPLLIDLDLSGFISSFGLYFKKFEFNASVYFLLRELGFWIKGYNIIGTLGPVLGIASFTGIVLISGIGVAKKWSLPQIFLFSWTTYLLLSTTVHPWYVLPLITLGLLSGYWYPVVWSFVIFATYFGYIENGFELSPIWLVLEYVTVILFFIFETFKKLHAKD